MHANGDSNMDTSNEYTCFYGHGYVLLMLGIPWALKWIGSK
jgi:hypothetical protein